LCDDIPAEQISQATGTAAITILGWLAAETHRVLNELKHEGAVEKRWTGCESMLQKIQEKGPILKRSLYRTYDVQNQAILNPILEVLVESGQVVKDPDGRLRTCADAEKADKPKICTAPPCRTDSPDTLSAHGQS